MLCTPGRAKLSIVSRELNVSFDSLPDHALLYSRLIGTIEKSIAVMLQGTKKRSEATVQHGG